MSLFAISDLHLSLNGDKPMDIFGERWERHHERLKEHWEGVVGGDDTVIIGGDISWALRLEETALDFQFIHALPGRKVFFKGNHDYWWQSYAKVKEFLPQSICAVQNNYCRYDSHTAICGTRGWNVPGSTIFSEHDDRIYRRELVRLELSLSMAKKDGFGKTVAVLHYPPFSPALEDSEFVAVLQKYNVKLCLYGHLHGEDHCRAFIGERDGIQYHFIAGDYLNFRPLQIL
jgi:uncharacterized protein